MVMTHRYGFLDCGKWAAPAGSVGDWMGRQEVNARSAERFHVAASAALKQPIPLPQISILSKANPLKHFQHMCASTLFSMSQVCEGLNSQPSP